MHLADARFHPSLARWAGPLALFAFVTAFTSPSAPSPDHDVDPRIEGYDGPCLLEVTSSSNEALLVRFDRPMDDAVLDSGNYVVIHDDGSQRRLDVRSTTLIDPEFTSVRLETSPQTHATYRLTVVDVRDALERRPAPASGSWNPMAMRFEGTPLSEEDPTFRGKP